MSLLKNTIFASQTRKLVANVVYRTYSSQEGIPEFESLAVSVPKQHVFHVELNRPDKLNSFSHSMWGELKECFSSLSENPECRVVVLSARGKHFTAGIDLNDFMKQGMAAQDIDDVARKAKYFNRMIGLYQDGITALEDCAKPVFVVVHNACVGAGVDLITAADVRYCTEEAWFQVKEVDVGLAADVGTLQRLPKVVGSSSVVRELCYTARKFQAKEALQIGLVSKVFANQEKALEHVIQVAENVAAKSPVAVQVTKQSLVYSQSRPTKDGLDHIRLINQAMLQNEDLTKSAMAAVTKEKAEFEDL